MNINKTNSYIKNYNNISDDGRSFTIEKNLSYNNNQNNKRSRNNNSFLKNYDSDKGPIKKYKNYYTNNNNKNLYNFFDNDKYINKTVSIDNNIDYNNDNNISYYLNYTNEVNNENKNYKITNNLNGYNYLTKNLSNLNKKDYAKKINIRKNICLNCLKNFGNIKFLDRKGNSFCSHKCMIEFIKIKK